MGLSPVTLPRGLTYLHNKQVIAGYILGRAAIFGIVKKSL